MEKAAADEREVAIAAARSGAATLTNLDEEATDRSMLGNQADEGESKEEDEV